METTIMGFGLTLMTRCRVNHAVWGSNVQIVLVVNRGLGFRGLAA